MWTVILLDEVDQWFVDLAKQDPDTAELVMAAIDKLEVDGPALGRPLVDRVKGSAYHAMKELRPGSAGGSEVRILFIFDPERRAILLTAGDKRGRWKAWYTRQIPVADERYKRWLAGDYESGVERGS